MVAPIANFAVERGCQSAIPVIAVPITSCLAQRRFSGQALKAGEAIGKHARSAVGMSGLPFNNAVEVEMIVEVAE
jgi:hypothetical protein